MRISAICVTHYSRYGLLQRAIINFLEQDYADRELVIICGEDGHADMIRAFLRDYRLKAMFPSLDITGMVRAYQLRFRETIEAYLYGLAWTTGEMIALWDDDNLSHPDRLAWQAPLSMEQATCLAEAFYYFYDSDELFVTNFDQPTGRPAERCAPASLMLHRSLVPALDLATRDLWSNLALDKLALRQAYDFLHGHPEMFLVGSNGNNARDGEFHRRQGSGLPATWTRDQLIAQSGEVEAWVKAYRFPKDLVEVAGKDASAFEVQPVPTWPLWLRSPLPPADWHLQLPNRAIQDRLAEERNEAAEQAAAARAAAEKSK